MVSRRTVLAAVCATAALLAAPHASPAALQAPRRASTPARLADTFGNLNGPWRFRTDPADVGEREGWQKQTHDDAAWRTLTPGSRWEVQGITDPRPGQPPKPMGGMPAADYDGAAWYRRAFDIPAAWRGKPLLLHLDKIDDLDRTYMNGRLVGQTLPTVAVPSQRVRSYRVPAGLVRPGARNVVAVRVWDGGGPGGMVGTDLWLLPEGRTKVSVRIPQADRPLAARFANPPGDARILKIIHGWPDEPAAQDATIRALAEQGFGGVVCNVSFDQYMVSDAKMRAFVRAVGQARKAGMAMWLYDERGYPSGTAGGLTLKGHPEWEARGLFVADRFVGPGPVSIDLAPGTVRAAWAYPVGVGTGAALTDLRSSVAAGKLTWTAPDGRWHVAVITEDRLFEGTHATMSLADHIPQINMLMAEPTRRFIEITHGAYARILGADLGKYFTATFTDEPSLMSFFLKPMPYRPLPWSPDFAQEFRRRRGYDIEPLLAHLAIDTGPQARKVRYDYWLTVSELVSSTFFGQIRDWCRKHNIQSGGHLLLEETLTGHVPLYGDFMRCVRLLDAPSIDCLTSVPPEVPWQIARLVSSAAELEGRTVTMSETSDHVQVYRPQGDTRPPRVVSADEIRGTCNRLMAGGVNTITSYYSFTGLSGDQLRRLNTYIGRCATMLRGGHQVADIAVVYPIESVWPVFRPSRSWAGDSAEAVRIQTTYNAVSDALYAAGRDYTYIDSRAIANSKVVGGTLVHGKLRWRAVVLPGVDTLPRAAWDRLAQFQRGGGLVVAVGALPANTDREFPSAAVQAQARGMFGAPSGPSVHAAGSGAGIFLPGGTESLVPEAIGAVLPPDVRVRPAGAPIRSTHRRVDDHDVYFLINDSAAPFAGEVSLSGRGPGTVWDPVTGKTRAVPGPASIRLSLAPYSGVLVRFERAVAPRRRAAAPGPLAGNRPAAMSLEPPTVGHGEFVRGTVAPAGDAAQAPGAHVARATLMRSQADTHLFVRFQLTGTGGLAGVKSLVFDTWVPPGQETTAQLLALVQERSGAIYIAELGRPLGAPGKMTSYVPVEALRLAGFSSDANGKLDLADVVAINVGWGGYFGTEGEVIEFTVAPPGATRAR